MRWIAAKNYDSLLNPLESLLIPELLSPQEHVFHLYVVRCQQRDRIRAILTEKGIQTGIHYPRPFYLEPGFSQLGYTQGSFPQTEALAQQILSLPIYPGITANSVEIVCHNLKKILN